MVVDGIVVVLVDSGLLVDSSLLALTDVAAIEITPTSATVPISHFGARGRPRVALVGNAGGVSIEVMGFVVLLAVGGNQIFTGYSPYQCVSARTSPKSSNNLEK